MMSLRWDPLNEMNRLRSETDRLLGRYDGGEPRRPGAAVFPPLNLWEDENNLHVEAELPGFELSHLEIYVTGGNQLSIRGERKPPEREGGTWHRQERGFGSFSRMVELPAVVESEGVSAEFKHGVLTITLPKHEEAKPRRIEVKAS